MICVIKPCLFYVILGTTFLYALTCSSYGCCAVQWCFSGAGLSLILCRLATPAQAVDKRLQMRTGERQTLAFRSSLERITSTEPIECLRMQKKSKKMVSHG